MSKNYKKPSSVETFFGVIGIVLIGLFSLLVASKIYSWYLPSPETASSLKRLTAFLFFPLYLAIILPLLIGYFLAVAAIKKMFGLGPWSADRGLERPQGEVKDDRKGRPSTLPYWLMVILLGGLFLAGLYFIVQDMLIRHFPGEDWVIIVFALLILGIPATIGILRIREIKKGVPQPPNGSQARKPLPPGAAALLVGLMVALLLGGGSFMIWRTTEFLKTALPTTGVVTRWIHHSSGRSGYEDLEVCFTTQKGVKLTLESRNRSGLEFLMPNVGQTVKVLYDPTEPADFRVDQFSELWSRPILAFLIALAIIVATVISYRRRKALQAP